MAVGALVLVMLASVAAESMKANRQVVATLLATNAASSAADLIAADLDGTLGLTGTNEYLHMQAETIGGTRSSRLAVLCNSPNNENPADPSSPRPGQPAIVLYRLGLYDADTLEPGASPANPTYALYRSVIPAQTSFDAFAMTGDLSAPSSPQLFSGLPVQDDLLVNNIVDFRVVFYAAGATAPLNMSGGTLGSFRLNGSGSTPAASARPVTAEITITVLSEEGARLVQGGTLNLTEAKRRHGYTQVRRVVLR